MYNIDGGITHDTTYNYWFMQKYSGVISENNGFVSHISTTTNAYCL